MSTLSTKVLVVGAFAALLLAGPALARGRGGSPGRGGGSATQTGARGDLSGATTSRASGRYAMLKVTNRRGTGEKIDAAARHLDMTRDGSGNRPTYNLFLVSSDRSTAVDFGQMRVNRRGQAAFHFNTRNGTLPSGVTSITDFDGGAVQVRDGSSNTVLTGSITFQ